MKRTLVLILALLSAPAARGESALERTRQLVAAFKSVKPAPADNTAAYKALDQFFDFPSFVRACLPAAHKLTAPQVKEFEERLTAILRGNGYSNGGSAFQEGVLSEGKATEARVPLTLKFPARDVTLELAFAWKGGRVVDLIIDGDSLAKDNQNQVARVLAKTGPEDLLRRLAEKQKR